MKNFSYVLSAKNDQGDHLYEVSLACSEHQSHHQGDMTISIDSSLSHEVFLETTRLSIAGWIILYDHVESLNEDEFDAFKVARNFEWQAKMSQGKKIH